MKKKSLLAKGIDGIRDRHRMLTMRTRTFFMAALAVVIAGNFLAPASLAAQEPDGAVDAAYLMRSVNILYRLTFDEDFYYLANEAGVYIWDDYAGDFPPKEFWAFSVESVLSEADNVARVFQFNDGREESHGEDPLDAAARLGIPVFVDIYISGNVTTGETSARYTFIDLYSSQHVLDKTIIEHIPTKDDLLLFYWAQTRNDLADFIVPILKPPLTIRAPTGAVVTGFGADLLVIPESGELLIDVAMPGTYKWTMTHKKFHNAEGMFLAERDANELSISARKFYPSSIDIALYLACFPELRYTRAFHNGWYFSLGVQQQVFGLFAKKGAPLETSFSRVPLIMPVIALGYHFKTPDSPLRPYLESSLQFRLDYERIRAKTGRVFDAFSPLALNLAAGYDWELSALFALFLEAGASVYFLQDGWESASSKGMNNKGIIQTTFGGFVSFELPSIRLGIRVKMPF